MDLENIKKYFNTDNKKRDQNENNINDVEQQRNIGMRSEYSTEVKDFVGGLNYVKNMNIDDEYKEQNKIKYSLVSQTIKDKPMLEVKHTQSDWRGFGKGSKKPNY